MDILLPLFSNPQTFILQILAPILFGACVGSFLNVCIYRMPLNRSVVTPASRCFTCGSALPWHVNIPIISWFILRGRCSCQLSKLSFRYPLVELITSFLTLIIWNLYPPAQAAVYLIFTYGLIIATFVDLDHFIIPDEISLGGCVVGLILSAVVPQIHGSSTALSGFTQSLIGMAIGGGLLILIAIGGSLLLRKEAMGMGDVKLVAAMGAFLGWQAPLFIIAVSSMIGSVIGIGLMVRKQRRWGIKMPFGPFLALAGVLWVIQGHKWMAQYLSIFQNSSP